MQEREKRGDQTARLQSTECGRVLLSLISEYGSQAKLASACGFSKDVVAKWVEVGRISRRGAIALEELTGRMKEEFRPDLPPSQWNHQIPGRVPGKAAEINTPDSRLLVRLAEKFGSVAELCKAAHITVNSYHQWKSRGRIPAIKLPTLAAMDGKR